MPQSATLSALRRAVAALESGAAPDASARFSLGSPALDAWLGGGLAHGALHEVQAGHGYDHGHDHARYPAASIGFGLGMAARASGGRPLVWVRQDVSDAEVGQPYGGGLAAFGLDPSRCLVVRAADPTGALRAAAEAARCPSLGAALVEIRGSPKVLDLTASRRLALAAGASGVTVVMIRLGPVAPSAAASRWRVEAASSTVLEADAPGHPAFAATLLRHRSGLGPRTWRLEWDRDGATFAAPARASPTLPRPALPVPARGPAAAEDAEGDGAGSRRCAG